MKTALNKSNGLSQWLRQENIDNLQWEFDDCRNDLSLKNKWRTIDKLQKEKLPKIWKLTNKWRTIDKSQKGKLPKIWKLLNKWGIIDSEQLYIYAYRYIGEESLTRRITGTCTAGEAIRASAVHALCACASPASLRQWPRGSAGGRALCVTLYESHCSQNSCCVYRIVTICLYTYMEAPSRRPW